MGYSDYQLRYILGVGTTKWAKIISSVQEAKLPSSIAYRLTSTPRVVPLTSDSWLNNVSRFVHFVAPYEGGFVTVESTTPQVDLANEADLRAYDESAHQKLVCQYDNSGRLQSRMQVDSIKGNTLKKIYLKEREITLQFDPEDFMDKVEYYCLNLTTKGVKGWKTGGMTSLVHDLIDWGDNYVTIDNFGFMERTLGDQTQPSNGSSDSKRRMDCIQELIRIGELSDCFKGGNVKDYKYAQRDGKLFALTLLQGATKRGVESDSVAVLALRLGENTHSSVLRQHITKIEASKNLVGSVQSLGDLEVALDEQGGAWIFHYKSGNGKGKQAQTSIKYVQGDEITPIDTLVGIYKPIHNAKGGIVLLNEKTGKEHKYTPPGAQVLDL